MGTKQMQCLLLYLGYGVSPDGVWGSRTQEAVDCFEQEFGSGEPMEAALRQAVAQDWKRPERNFWAEIQYFKREEFRCPCGKCGGFPAEPGEDLVRQMDSMRKSFGRAVIVVPEDGHSGGSGVRCQAYNATLKGSVPNSRHLLGKAADFSAPGVGSAVIEAWLRTAQAEGRVGYWYRITTGSYHMETA